MPNCSILNNSNNNTSSAFYSRTQHVDAAIVMSKLWTKKNLMFLFFIGFK